MQLVVLLSYVTQIFLTKGLLHLKSCCCCATTAACPPKTFGHPFRSEFAMLQVRIRSRPDLFCSARLGTCRNPVAEVGGGLVGTKPHLAIAPSHSACLLGGRADGEQGLQGSAKRLWQGLVNFVTALAYHFCLALPAAFTQPGQSLLADPSMHLR